MGAESSDSSCSSLKHIHLSSMLVGSDSITAIHGNCLWRVLPSPDMDARATAPCRSRSRSRGRPDRARRAGSRDSACSPSNRRNPDGTSESEGSKEAARDADLAKVPSDASYAKVMLSAIICFAKAVVRHYVDLRQA